MGFKAIALNMNKLSRIYLVTGFPAAAAWPKNLKKPVS